MIKFYLPAVPHIDFDMIENEKDITFATCWERRTVLPDSTTMFIDPSNAEN